MAKQSKQGRAPKPNEAAPREGWRPAVRGAVSVLIVWHLFVLFISPLSVRPSSPLVVEIAQSQWLRWYSDPLYLNHGYHFFGPDPPLGGTLVRYQVLGDDGQEIAAGEFPNLDQQWPRLWYHRHMMLADQMSGVGVYGDPESDRRLMLQAYARHLLRRHDGAEARIDNVWHRSLLPRDVQDGLDPYDPRFYETITTAVQRRSDLDTPLLPAASPRPVESELLPIGAGR